MTKHMWTAAALMGLTTGVHLFVGTSEIMPPILDAPSLDPVIKATSMVVWHGVTLILFLLTCGIAYLARQSNPALKWFVIAVQLGFASLFLFYNITSFSALFVMPQWTVFILCPAMMVFHRPQMIPS